MTKRSIFRRRNRSTVPADRSSRGRDGKGGGSVGRSRVSTGKRANLETLEKRELLAFDLVSISADVAQQFDLTPGAVNELQSPPRELTFRFDGNAVVDPASLASGIIITPAGGDGAFDGSEIPITPGFIGLGATDRIVVARFSGDLPDDLYRVTVSADPITGVRATDGDVLSEQFDVLVDLNLGPRVVAVVPQPIEGTVGSRQQLVNTIEVYFNDDPLSSVAAGPINSGSSTLPVVTPENYRLFLTQQTIENTDDVVSTPDSVSYDPVSNLATLTFANGVLTEGGLFRLRIGSGEAVAAPGDRGPAVIAAIEQGPSGTNDVFFNAQRAINANSVDEGAFNIADGLQSVVFQGGEIRNSGAFVLQWPGAFENPGIRDQRREANQTRPFDTIDGINIYSYNFAELYGLDAQGELLDNAITEAQKQRVREALDLYEEHLGVRFVETEDSGLQIVNGDLRGLQQTADVSAGDGTPRSIFRINERDPSRGVLVLDSSENFFDASFGLSPDSRPSFFVEAVRGIGNVIGIGDFFELPTGVDGAVGSQDEPNSETFSNDGDGTNFSAIGVRGTPTPTGEPDFLSHAARVIGQAVNRPESSDIDFYEFSVVRPVGETGVGTVGEVVIETYAQRLDDSSLLDSVLQLYQVTGTPGNETFTLVSQNDDSFGDDSLIRLSLEEGRYIVGVSSVGNDEYFGELEGSGNGGRSEGRYDLRVTFTPSVGIGGGTLSGLSDTDGSLLDGDADGVAGGNFNFFFRTTSENAAAVADRESRTIFVSKDADGSAVGNGSVNQPLDTIEAALDLAEPDDIVRLLPSLGADGDLDTLDDNNAYEIGFGGPNNQQLDDGASLEVPAGVTVVIDAGAIVKLRDAKIVVGSESTTDDRSESALQILGTPDNNVILTSFNETTLGNSTNTLNVTPQPGDWAGIEFRDDVDAAEAFGTFADEGIFLDYISNADIRFGGGSVTATAPAVAPIQLANSRPTIINNTISNSAGPAISADPNSFREDLFNSPRFQQRLNVPGSTNNEYQFTSDYNRVGPEIYGNALFNNSVNGLFVRVDTPIAGQTETLTVPGRFDDTDITHVIAETLVISGNPGGPTLLENRPNIGGVSSTAINGVGGEIPAGTYEYRLSFVTEDGQESLLSLATRTVTVNGSQAVQLTGLPVAPAEFAGRLLYRGLVGGSDFELVDTLNATSTQFLDTLSNQDIRGGLPRQSVITSFNATTVTVAPVAGAGTFPLGNTFDYRFTFADPFGGETQASGPTLTAVAPQDGAFQLANIPVAPDGFVGTNVFRLDPITGDYILVAELRNGQTEFLDIGFVPQVDLTGGANASILGRVLGSDINGGTRLLPRFDARLTVDPGIIVKLNAARIEASFGADFYAEGTPERPIFFTSINDDTVGTTLSFDVSNNGETTGSAGDFGGISIRNQSTGSFDHVNIRFAGGEVPLSGGLRDVNALEIIQSEVRVTNSVFENNDDGFGVANADDPRFGLGFNSPATIFVRGAQPIIVGNTITNDASSISSGAAISINPNALTSESVVDRGRLTGPSERLFINLDNQGPLLENNLIGNHRINGLEVRGEVVTVDSVFDDTDITHVVEDPIVSVTNAFGGAIRLRSSSDESLVVKFGQDGTLVASGRPLDIEDRIGGTLQVLGTNSFPVVLTSLNDDSIGSGNTPIGLPSNDTLGVEVLGADGEPVQPGAGDWIGLQILAYANDRNVTYQYETETAQPGDINANGTPQVAEGLGTLARGEGSGDENTRLGFTLRGTLATPDDVDTYEFDASGQTLVTIDIDETDLGLDTVVELVTLEGEVIARSDNSFAESVGREALFVDEAVGSGVLRSDVRPLLTSPGGSNVESPNDADAGFRVVLPGEPLSTSTFFVRVRTAEGISSGQYTLSIRLGNESEVAGSTVRRADIRFASTAILVTSTPTSSPLTTDAGEVVELIDPTPGDRNSGDERAVESVDTRLNANFGQAQPLGNLLTSDRGVLTVSGEIGNLDGSLTQGIQFESLIDERLEDVDVFRVDLFNQQIRPDVFDSENRFVTATFDIDFADQLGRPNTRLHIFDSAGRLILTGNDSSIADDVALPSGGIGTSSLTGGSQGTRDAFIGPVELLEGTYYVAVTSVATVPQVLDQFFEPNATAGDVRLRPIDSVRTLSFDSFEELIVTDPFSGTPIDIGVTGRLDELTAEAPLNEAAFDTNPDTGDEAIIPFNLSDISLFVSYNQSIDGPDRASITQFNPFTGELIRVIGDHPNENNDIALRPDGEIYSFASTNAAGEPFNNGTVGGFQNISTLDGGINRDTDEAVVFFTTNPQGTDLVADDGVVFFAEALVFDQILTDSSINTQAITDQNAATAYVSGTRSNQGSGGEIPESLTRNIVYAFNSNSGEFLSAGGGIQGSALATADRNFNGQIPYNTSFGPAAEEIEVGIIDVGQFELEDGEEIANITGLARSQESQLAGESVFLGVTDQGGIFEFDISVLVDAPANSDAFGFNRVIPTTSIGTIPPVPGHNPVGGVLSFTGVSYGPRAVEGGEFEDVLFATTEDGWLYAFRLVEDADTGETTAEIANVFFNGRGAVELTFLANGLPVNGSAPSGPSGLAFSNLVVNPFHVTNDRFDDLGHGAVTTPNLSRQPLGIGGGNSLFFGFEVTPDTEDNTVARPDNDPLGDISPGGAHGSVISDQFDLSEFSAGDEPTLYFTYHIEVEANDDFNLPNTPQRDAFRVFGTDDSGQWQLLATNNSFRQLENPDEFDNFFDTGIPVQEIFDDQANNGNFRQARIDLSPFAGSENVRIRFDFNTAGAARTQFGSVELVGVAGDRVEDGATTELIDDDGNLIVLQSVVGQNLVFGTDGNNATSVNAGDTITFLDRQGDFTTLTYVDQLSVNPLPANQIEVLLPATGNPSPVQLSRLTALALPVSFGASVTASGSVNVAEVSRIIPGETIAAGSNRPIISFASLNLPSSIEAVSGEAFSITVDGVTELFSFTPSAVFNAAPDVFLGGVVNPIVFDDSIVNPAEQESSVIFEAIGRINDAFGSTVAFFDGSTVRLDALADNVEVETFAGPTQISLPAATRSSVTLPDGANLQNREILQITADNTVVELVLLRDGETFGGTSGPIEVNFGAGDTAAQIGQLIVDAVGDQNGFNLIATADGFDILSDNNEVVQLTVLGEPSGVIGSTVNTLLLNTPSGFQVVNNQVIEVSVGDQLFEFVLSVDDQPVLIEQGQILVEIDSEDFSSVVAERLANILASLETGATVSTDFFGLFLQSPSTIPINIEVVETIGVASGFDVTPSTVSTIGIPEVNTIRSGDVISVTSGTESTDLVLVRDGEAFTPQMGQTAIPVFENDTMGTLSVRIADALIDFDGFLSVTPLGFSVQFFNVTGLLTSAQVSSTPSGVSTVSAISIGSLDGSGLRTGETIQVTSGDVIVDVVFVRNGDFVATGDNQIIVNFEESDTNAEVAQNVVDALQGFDPTIAATVNAIGVEIENETLPIASLGIDPVIVSVTTPSRSGEYLIPLTVPQVVNNLDTLSFFRQDSPGQQTADVITFVSGTPDDPNTPINNNDLTVVFDPNDDAAAIAQRIVNELPFLQPRVSGLSERVVEFAAVSSLNTAGTGFISFTPIVNTSQGPGNLVRAVPVIVNTFDTADEVAEAIQVGLINTLGFLVNDSVGNGLNLENTATPGNFDINAGSRVRVFGTTLINDGTFGSSTFLPGDEFGVAPSNAFTRMQVDTASADNNVIEGVYIDDIVIGFAERGEVVLYNDYLGEAANPNFVIDPAFVPETRADALQPENPDEVVVGPYRLEIRTGDEFGVPNDFDPINLVLSEDVGSGRSFDTNDRLSDGAVSLVLPEGADLLDGDSFVLDDGQATVTFEFNNALSLGDARDQIQLGNVAINFLPTDSNADIARRVRDAINSQLFELSSDGASSSGTLRIQAISGDGRLAGATTSGRVELFGENITVNPTLSASTVDSNGVRGSTNGRLIQIDGVAAETPFGNFSSRRIPLVDQDSRTVVSAQFRNITIDAFPTGYVPGDTLVVDGRIGDQVASGIPNNVSADDGAILGTNPIQDTDVYRIFLEAGTSIDLDVDAAGLFRDTSVLGLPVIFIYPQGFVPNIETSGAFPDGVGFSGLTPTAGQGETSLGANLTFVAQETGFYDVQVSSQFAFQNQFGLVPIGEDEIFDVGTGEYQLTIRPTNATGVPVRDVIQVDYQFGRTDTNRTIDQGQLIIEQNIIRDSAQFGIDLITERGLRATSTDGLFPILGQGGSIGGTQLDDLSVAGTPGLLRNQNTFGLVTGTVVVNNLIIDSPPEGDDIDTDNSTGIRLTGGSFDDGQSPGPNVFARLINNTIVGDGNGVGIEVGGRAAPTIANNVLVGLTDGIVADTVTASLTETTSNVIADVANPSTLPIGQSTFVLEESDGLFIGDASNGLFIPAANSPLIDSSAGSIDDREELFNTVKLAVGLSESPILAPQFDASGNQRVDTPGQGASGTGQNVFADRGALDNADAGGPMARLTTPLDLNAAVSASLVTAFGSDADPAPSIVRLVDDIAIPFIEIELSDFGVGVNDASVVSGAVILRENGVELEEGTDYLFGFSNSGSTIRLTSTRGEFARDATYEIELSQSIVDLAGNPLEATSAGDQTILTILTAGVSFDFGDAPSPFQVQSSNNGPSHANPGVDSPRLGSRVDAELDGANSLNSLGDDALAQVSIDATAAASISTGPLTGGSSLTFNSLPLAGETVDFILGSETFTIEFTDALSNPAVGNIAIDISSADIATIRANLATRIRAEIQSQAGSIEVTDATIDPTLAEGLITFLSFDDEDGVPIGRFQTPGGQSVLLFGNPDANGVLQAGDVQGVLVPGQTTFIVVNATVPEGQQAFLDGWIDFGLDGVFSRADQFAEAVELFDGENLISVSVPSNAGNGNAIGDLIADTVARFRISNTGFLDPTGVAIGGEVEDHQISLLTNNLGLPQNTSPSFDNTTTTIIVEEDATTALSVVQNVLPGSPTNQVENEQQSLLPPTVAIVPGGDPDNVLVGGSLLVQEVFQEDGTLDYDLVFETNPNVSGTVELVITISDDQVPPATTEVAISLVVAPVNDLPTFTLEGDLDPDMSGDPTISIDEGAGTVTVDVIAESSAGPGEVSDVTFQVRVVDADDVARFTVEPFFNENGDLVFELGDDEFTPANDPIELEIVAFDDENLPSQPQIITLFVTNVPDVPVANDDPGIGQPAFTTSEDDQLLITAATLLANDTDGDLPNDVLSVAFPNGQSEITTLRGATVRLVGSDVIYDPTGSAELQSLANAGESIVDTFEYLAVDSTNASGAATVSITVTGANDAPIAVNQSVGVQASGLTRVPLIVTDPDDDPATPDAQVDFNSVVITFQPSFGTVFYDPSTREFVYNTNSSLIGQDQFRFTIADQFGARSQEATIFVSTNPAPVAVSDQFGAVSGRELLVNIAANDTDNVAIDLSSIQIETAAGNGTVELVPGMPGFVRYVSDVGFSGTDSFTYTIADNEGARSLPATVTFVVQANALQNPDLDTGELLDGSGEFVNTDVNNDNVVSPIDALLVINALRAFNGFVNNPNSPNLDPRFSSLQPNENGAFTFDASQLTFSPGENIFFWDVDGNDLVQPLDALLVINRLRRDSVSSASEPESLVSSSLVASDADSSLEFTPIDTTSASVAAFQLESSVALAAEIEAFQSAQSIASFDGGQSSDSSDRVDDDLIDLVAAGIDQTTAPSSPLDRLLAEMDF